jgi:hypothetical protein
MKGVDVRLSALLALVLFASVLRANPVSLAFVSGGGNYTITFDTSKISEHRIRELVILSPFIVDYTDATTTKDFRAAGSKVGDVVDKSLLALPLEQCIETDPTYTDCANNDFSAPNFLRNAAINVERSKRGLMSLKQLDYPVELQSVGKFLQDGLALSLWIESARLRYYTTWGERILKEAHEGLNPALDCQDVFKSLQTTNSNEDKYETVRFDWANCMVRAADRLLGKYPTKSWNSFLRAYDVREEYNEQGPD